MEWILPAMLFYTSLRYSGLITASGKTFGENHHLCMLVYIWWIFTEVISEEFRLSKASPSSEICEAVNDFSFLCFQCSVGCIQVEQKWKLPERNQILERKSRERCWARMPHLAPGRVKRCDTNYSQKKKQKTQRLGMNKNKERSENSAICIWSQTLLPVVLNYRNRSSFFLIVLSKSH